MTCTVGFLFNQDKICDVRVFVWLCAPLVSALKEKKRKGCGPEGCGTSDRGMRYRTHGASASDARSEIAPSAAGKRTEGTIKTPIVEVKLPASRFAQEAEIHWKKKKKKKVEIPQTIAWEWEAGS